MKITFSYFASNFVRLDFTLVGQNLHNLHNVGMKYSVLFMKTFCPGRGEGEGMPLTKGGKGNTTNFNFWFVPQSK